MNVALLFLFIFGIGHPSRDPLDPAMGFQLHSRIKCDGYGAPEDLLRMRPTLSKAGVQEFVVSRYHTERCRVDVKGKCLHHEKAGWRDVWTSSNTPPLGNALVPVGACYEWGSTDPSQYVLSGWYNEGTDSKPIWRQVRVKQLSTQPEAYEFTDPLSGTARVEIDR